VVDGWFGSTGNGWACLKSGFNLARGETIFIFRFDNPAGDRFVSKKSAQLCG